MGCQGYSNNPIKQFYILQSFEIEHAKKKQMYVFRRRVLFWKMEPAYYLNVHMRMLLPVQNVFASAHAYVVNQPDEASNRCTKQQFINENCKI